MSEIDSHVSNSENPPNLIMASHMTAFLSAIVAADAVVDAAFPQVEHVNPTTSLLQFVVAAGVSFACAALPKFIEDHMIIDRMSS